MVSPSLAQTTAETLPPDTLPLATADQSKQPTLESAVPPVAAPPAAEESAKTQFITPGKGEGGTDVATRKEAEAEVAAEVAQAVPLPPGTQAQGQRLTGGLQAEAEGGSLQAMATLGSGREAESGVAQHPQAPSPVMGGAAEPGAGDAAVAGTAPESTETEASRDLSRGQRPAEVAQDPAAMVAAAVAGLESAWPASAQEWKYAALPANVAARLAQIDAENAARMQVPAQTAEVGAATAAVTEPSPTVATRVVHKASRNCWKTWFSTLRGTSLNMNNMLVNASRAAAGSQWSHPLRPARSPPLCLTCCSMYGTAAGCALSSLMAAVGTRQHCLRAHRLSLSICRLVFVADAACAVASSSRIVALQCT